MGIPLVRGRTFNDQDSRENPRVTIVDEHMAAQLWPGQDAIGKRIRTGGPDSTSPWVTVVGVVGRVKQYALDSDSRIAMYLAQAQYPVRAMNVVIKTASAPENLTATVRKEVRELDPNLPIYGVRTMSDRVGDSIATRRFSVVLLTVFASLALALATVGVYGVITYLVDQGTRELGIRMALGATPGGITNMVIRQGLLLGGIGVAVGIAGALLLTRFLSSLLFGIEPTDPITFVAIGFLMMMVAIISSYIPARRAARIDPVISLRTE
jgi:predicted permease